MRRLSWDVGCWLVGGAVLGVLAWRTGTDPFLAGISSLDVETLALGVVLAVPITVAGAWRWRLVARGLGIGIAPAAAVASCYRAQFLNTVLPGGVLGDVHRGVRHGRRARATGRALRAVAWERTAGQVVQAFLAVGVLLLLPSPVRASLPWLVAVAAAAGVALALGCRPPVRARWLARPGRVLHDDLRRGVLARAAWPGIVVASTVAVAGHVATFLVAARAAGVTAPLRTLLPLVLLVLVAAGLPTNVAGWGPREGMAAWAFGAAGLGAGQGLAAAVSYGAVVAVASLPGLAVLVAGWAGRRGARPSTARAVSAPVALAGAGEGGGRG